jgi:hypothetical protein
MPLTVEEVARGHRNYCGWGIEVGATSGEEKEPIVNRQNTAAGRLEGCLNVELKLTASGRMPEIPCTTPGCRTARLDMIRNPSRDDNQLCYGNKIHMSMIPLSRCLAHVPRSGEFCILRYA